MVGKNNIFSTAAQADGRAVIFYALIAALECLINEVFKKPGHSFGILILRVECIMGRLRWKYLTKIYIVSKNSAYRRGLKIKDMIKRVLSSLSAGAS